MQQQKEIRAFYTEQFIRVYQAYNNVIADSAIKSSRFVSPPFKLERATWIKPSFLWMMYRSGWATKENQERILAIDMTHEGFKWALENTVLSHFDPDIYKTYEDWQKTKENAPVVIQWDPERDIYLNKLDYRTIQIGLTPPAAKLYIGNWTLKITDITDTVKTIKQLVDENKMEEANTLLPLERLYSPIQYK